MLAWDVVQIVIGNVHAGCRRVGQRACASEDAQTGRNAVCHIEVTEVKPGNAIVVIHDDFNGRTPAIASIVTATANDIAPLRDVCATKRERNRKCSAEKEAATVRQVREKRIFDAVVGAAANAAPIAVKGKLSGTMATDLF